MRITPAASFAPTDELVDERERQRPHYLTTHGYSIRLVWISGYLFQLSAAGKCHAHDDANYGLVFPFRGNLTGSSTAARKRASFWIIWAACEVQRITRQPHYARRYVALRQYSVPCDDNGERFRPACLPIQRYYSPGLGKVYDE